MSMTPATPLRRLIWTLFGLLAIAIFIICTMFSLAAYERNRAQAFLVNFGRLNLGESSFADAKHLAEQYGGRPWSASGQRIECSNKDCDFRFVFENRPLNYISPVHRVAFTAGITVKDGHVVGREIEYESDTRSYYRFMYVMSDNADRPNAQSYKVQRLMVDPEGTPHVVKVTLGPTATPGEKKGAYAVNLSCLAKLYGCDAPSDIFPPVN